MPHCNSIQSSHINLRKYTNIKRPCPTISGHDLFEPEVRPSSAQPLNVRETRAHTTSIKLSNNKRWLFSIEKAVSD